MPSGEEMQSALTTFVTAWRDYDGSERSEAQTFLNQLFACYGSDRRQVAEFEAFTPGAGFMDLHWPEVCLIEMKAPTVPVRTAQAQAERYWRASADPETGRSAVRFIVVCNFRDVEVWDFHRNPNQPAAAFPLSELPDRYEALSFLAGPAVEPNFTEHYRELTAEAARAVAEVYHSLRDRAAAPPTEVHRFILRSVWCMFAEDLLLLDGYPFTETLRGVRSDPARSAADVGWLFTVLDQKGSHNRTGKLAGTRYVNGELFKSPNALTLTREEIDGLLTAATFDWRKVNPTIFGSLLEGVLGRERRWELGAHYTHEVDIMKIVTPTIVRPWRERISATTTPQQARDLLDELCRFTVLDPACGCGNFLYVAYRELRGLESELKTRIRTLAADTGHPLPPEPYPFYPISNIQGIEIERSAVLIARLTMWMGHKQMADLYGEAEAPLPLQPLDSIRAGDALRIPWPATDCIVGNPPFLGDRLLRRALGDDYLAWLKREFDGYVVDLAAYWFRKAADHLGAGQRAGLVSTNTLRENKHRRASLDYVVAKGGVITDAVSSQTWPGDAKVHVSLTNWVSNPLEPPHEFTLDGRQVSAITTQLREGEQADVETLTVNRGHSFVGCQPTGSGFILEEDEARELLGESDSMSEVVRRYLTGDDLAKDPQQEPTRWIIDFGTMPLERANAFGGAMRIVRERVKPGREGAARHFGRLWWQFAWPRPDMRAAVSALDRFVVSTLTGKRLLLRWCETSWTPSNLTGVFAFDDDYSMGILLSRAHSAWAWAQASTLETRLRYTPSSVFETFAWPDPVTDEQRERVAEASRRLLARRTQICTAEQIGLTKLYNAVDEGAWTDLAALHRDLDEAVAECYGWPRSVAQDDRELVRRLTSLNRDIIEGSRPYDPFG